MTKKIGWIVVVTLLLVSTFWLAGYTSVQAKEGGRETTQDKVLENQEKILQELKSIRQQLDIIRIRVS